MDTLGACATRGVLLAACMAGWFAACSGSPSTEEPPPGQAGAAGSSDAAAGAAGNAGAAVGGSGGSDAGGAGGKAGSEAGPPDAADASDGAEAAIEAEAGCPTQLEVCDGKDNNCDGNVDEGDPGGGGACDTGQLGACKAGTQHCTGGALQCAPLTVSKPEECNGIDDDCDGEIDEGTVAGAGELCVVPGQPQGTPCALSVNVCEAGVAVCKQTFFASSEICNGTDDDCNGTVDDPSAVEQQPCDTGLAGLCAQGLSSCHNGTGTCYEVLHPGDQPEVCNGKDDDCNGQLDEMDPTSECTQKYPAAQDVVSWACTLGACAIGQCAPARSDANGVAADGCECGQVAWAADCATATQVDVPLGTLPASPVTRTGAIPQKDGKAWFKVVFARPTMGTPYHFRISLTDSHGGEFKMNVRTACTEYASCTDGANAGQGAATWEVTTAYTQGAGCCADQLYFTEVLVEIYRVNAVSSCNTFTVTFTNY